MPPSAGTSLLTKAVPNGLSTQRFRPSALDVIRLSNETASRSDPIPRVGRDLIFRAGAGVRGGFLRCAGSGDAQVSRRVRGFQVPGRGRAGCGGQGTAGSGRRRARTSALGYATRRIAELGTVEQMVAFTTALRTAIRLARR